MNLFTQWFCVLYGQASGGSWGHDLFGDIPQQTCAPAEIAERFILTTASTIVCCTTNIVSAASKICTNSSSCVYTLSLCSSN